MSSVTNFYESFHHGILMAVRNTTRGLSRAAMQLVGLHCRGTPTATVALHLNQHCANGFSSNSSKGPRILTLSTILLQDGLEITELPVVVRKSDNALFPFSSHTYTSNEVKKISEHDEYFKLQLQGCISVKDVFRRLEIPSDKVTGYSASFALQRICQLKYSCLDGDDIDSFISTAIMNELFDTVSKEVSSLSNDTLTSLVRCYLQSDSFNAACVDKIKEEIQRRIGDEVFSITELCVLSDLLQTPGHSDSEMLQHIWVHIGSRYKDVNETNISRVFKSVPMRHRHVCKMINKQLQHCWWKLKGADVAMVISAMVKLNVFYPRSLNYFGNWVFMHMHEVTESEMMQIVAGFIHFKFSDPQLFRSLERFIPAKARKLDPNLLALVMEYCRSRRYLSPKIFSSVSEHFVKYGDSYNHLQLYSILRPFGQLNFQPSNGGMFYQKAEDILIEDFENFEIAHMAELLCSFAFVQRVPVNFVRRVLNILFISKVKGLQNKDERDAVEKYLELLQSAVRLETPGARVPHIFKRARGSYSQNNELYVLTRRLLEASLAQLIGPDMFRRSCYAPSTVYSIDFEIHLDSQKKAIKPSPDVQSAKKIALLIQMPEFYCVNTGHLLGEYAMRNRHLQILLYDVIELPYVEVRKLRSVSDRMEYLQYKLWEHIDTLTVNTGAR